MKQAIALLFMITGALIASAQEAVMDETVVVNAEGPADLSVAPTGEYRADIFRKYLMFSYDHRGWSSPPYSMAGF